MLHRRLMLLAACLFSIATSASAAVLSPFADAYLHRATSAPFLADINWDDPYRSGYRYLRVGGNDNYNLVSLLRFDLTGFAPNAIISDGLLRLHGSSGSDVSDSVRYLFNPLLKDWDEKAVTWNSFAATANGELDPASFDAVGWSQTVAAEPFAGSPFEITIPKSTLIAWATRPSENFGLLIRTDTPLSETLWYSKEVLSLAGISDVAEWAPTLSFNVNGVPEPSSGALLACGFLGLLAAIRRRTSCRGSTETHLRL